MTKSHSALDHFGIGMIVLLGILALVILVAPSIIVLIISFDTRAYVSFPPQGFTFDWYAKVFEQRVLVEAMLNSLQVGVAVTGLCILLGVPTALVCVRGRFPGTTALSVFVLVPHMVAGIVLGVSVLFAGALVGTGPSIWLQSIAIAVFVLAVMVRTVMSRLQRLDPALEEASANLGATPFQSLRAVDVPSAAPRNTCWRGLHLRRRLRQPVGCDLHTWLPRQAAACRASGAGADNQHAARRCDFGSPDPAGDRSSGAGRREHRPRQRQRIAYAACLQDRARGGHNTARAGANIPASRTERNSPNLSAWRLQLPPGHCQRNLG